MTPTTSKGRIAAVVAVAVLAATGAAAGASAPSGRVIMAEFADISPIIAGQQRFIDNTVYNDAGEPRPQWRYVIPDDHSLAILVRPRDGISQDATERLVDAVRATVDEAALPVDTVTVSGVPGIVAGLGRTVAAEIPLVGAVAIVAIGLCLFLVPWTRRRQRLVPLAVTVGATVLTVAALGLLGRPISLGVVAFLPVLVGLGSFYPTYVARGARLRTVAVVAGGTAAGFATLALSPLPFVRDLGLTLAIGVAIAVGLSVLVLRGRTTAAAPLPATEPTRTRSGRRRIALAVAAGAVAVSGWALLPVLPLQTSIDDLTAGLPALEDAHRVEQALGSGGELAVVLRGPDVLTPEAWTWMNTAQRTIVTAHGDEARPALSAPTLLGFLGDSPTKEQIAAGIRLLPPYLTSSVVRSDGLVAVLSFGVRLDDLDRLHRLVSAIQAELPPAPPGYTAALSGLPTVAVRGYDLVSADRYFACLAGLIAAGAVLLAGLRHRSDAARAVGAAAIATGTELCGLWLTGVALNPLTVALGSLTAAVGCEFTVMMCDGVRHRDPRLRTAVGLATLTSGVGFLVLTVSGLAVMREFGILLAVSVLLSFLAARLVVATFPPRPAEPPDEAPTPDRAPDSPALAGVV